MTWIQTFTGVAFDLGDPQPNTVRILDIAHALSKINRYNGHAKFPYSVAQHCVIMSEIVDEGHALWALLHDAAEAYVGDVARPLKRMLRGFDAIENAVARVILQNLGVSVSDSTRTAIKIADDRMLVTEAAQILGPPPKGWGPDVEPYEIVIDPWGHDYAKTAYLEAWGKLAAT